MRKFNKPGQLQGNTTVTSVIAPSLRGTVPFNSDGDIQTLADLPTPWSLNFNIETDQGVLDLTITDTVSANLVDIKEHINNDVQNTDLVVADVDAGVLRITSTSAGHGAFIRINPPSSGTSIASHFGFTTHPHSTATSYAGEIVSAAVDSENQQNPDGTSFLVDGEDRTSENFNRAIATVADNTQSNRVMLEKPLATILRIAIPDTSTRLIPSQNGDIHAIDLTDSITDSLTSALGSRILMGTLTNSSPVRDIRHLFKVTDQDGVELTYVYRAVSGSFTSSAITSTISLDATPNTSVSSAASLNDGGVAFSADIPKSSAVSISRYIDKHTVECDLASFITDGVTVGDILTIQGAAGPRNSNNGTYIVEKVVSETILEVKVDDYNDVAPFDTSITTGNASVSTGGMWLKNISLGIYPITPASFSSLYLTIPVEEILGDLPEDALIDRDIVEISYVANQNRGSGTLNDSYAGTDADSGDGAGYFINADPRPVHVTPADLRANPAASIDRNITIDILSNNRLYATGNASGFTDSDLGCVCRIHTTVTPSSITNSTILDEEPVIISKIIDGRTVEVSRVRSTEALPVTSGLTLDITTPTPTVTLPGSIVADVKTVGGISIVSDGSAESSLPTATETLLPFLILNRVKKLIPNSTSTYSTVATVTATGSDSLSLSATTVNGSYLKRSYITSSGAGLSGSLFCRVLNGPNAGYFRVNDIAWARLSPTIYTVDLLNLDGTTAALHQTSAQQYVCFYTATEASNVPVSNSTGTSFMASKAISSTSYSASSLSTGLSITSKGYANGMVVSANPIDNIDDLRKGEGAVGQANTIFNMGPGYQSNIHVITHGIPSWDSTMNSDAEVSVGHAGLGGFGVYSESTTYYASPLNNPSLGSAVFTYRSGAGAFESNTTDPALVATADGLEIDYEELSSAAGVFLHQTDNTFGFTENALNVHGNVYSSNRGLWYTESDATFYNLRPSHSDSITDSASWSESHAIGSDSVIGRVSNYHQKQARILPTDYSKFDLPHQFIVEVRSVAQSGAIPQYTYPDLFEPDPKKYVGAILFAARDYGLSPNSSLQALESVYGSSQFPFGLQNKETFIGPSKGFKIVGAYAENVYVYFAIKGRAPISIPDPTQLVNVIICRKPFKGRVDLTTSVLGKQSYVPSSYKYKVTSEPHHRDPVLFTKEQDFTVTRGGDSEQGRAPTSVSQASGLLEGVEDWSSLLVTDSVSNTDWRFYPIQYENNTRLNATVRSFAASRFSTSGAKDGYNLYGDFFTREIMARSSGSGNNAVVGVSGLVIPEQYSGSITRDNAFSGGGQKLAFYNNFYLKTQLANANHYVVCGVGSDILTTSSDITVSLVIAHLGVVDKPISISLKSTQSGTLTTALRYMYGGLSPLAPLPPLTERTYSTLSISFSSYLVDATTDILKEDLYIEISFATENGTNGLLTHYNISTLPQSELYDIGKSIFMHIDKAGNTAYSARFPDAVYLADLSITSDQKAASLSSGLDVEGIVRPRALRMLNGVVGYNTISPIQADLLQNTEYGNGIGNGRLPKDLTHDGLGGSLLSSSYQNDVNLEQGDVGLLPLWKSTFATGNSDIDVVEFINKLDSNSTDYDRTTQIGTVPSYTTQWQARSDNSVNNDVFAVDNTPVFTISCPPNLTLRDLVFTVENLSADDDEFTHLYYYRNLVPNGTMTFPPGSVGANGNDISGDPNPSDRGHRHVFAAGHIFVDFYKPTYDKASFFKKGIHSAAIHSYHPYYDPMFYWLNCAYGISKGKTEVELSGIEANLADVGSFRMNNTRAYASLTESSVNPDALKLPGRTGFAIPLDPPHGSRMTKIDINLSFRPMVSRKLSRVSRFSQLSDVSYSYGVWSSLPDYQSDTPPANQTGSYWLSKDAWEEKEGYVVKLWKHSMFDSGFEMGDDPYTSTKTHSNLNKKTEGNAVCIQSWEVKLRDGGQVGVIGDPAELVDGSVIHEGVSRFSRDLPEDSPQMLADRKNFSYFLTVEFYTGVRKEREFETSSGSIDGWTIPGLSFSHMDDFNASHFPYMWTTMYSHAPPTEGISSIYGLGEASLWQGLWHPHAKVSDTYYPQSVVRGSIPNLTRDVTSSLGNSTSTGAIMPSIDTRDTQATYGTFVGQNRIVVDIEGEEYGGEFIIEQFMEQPTGVPNHTLWYPIIKFRGARLTYVTDRPGHGGWGGDAH